MLCYDDLFLLCYVMMICFFSTPYRTANKYLFILKQLNLCCTVYLIFAAMFAIMCWTVYK